jgi:YHS domain-containing protein
LAITRDAEAMSVVTQYRLTILPMFVPFEGTDQLIMPLDAVDEAKIARWVEDKIVHFVETYMRLETAEQYQAENTATDLVCGMPVSTVRPGATLQHAGQTFYFCLDECRAKFEANPDHFLAPTTRRRT